MYQIENGHPHPLGATVTAEGVNFVVYSQHATGVELLLFNEHDDPQPTQTIVLDPRVNKTFHFWHVLVRGLSPGMHYGYRVDGPFDPARGHRFNRRKLLIDPYARGNTDNLWKRVDACGEADNMATSMRSVVIAWNGYDWRGDKRLCRPISESVIYEMHVGGFTRSPSSGVAHPGTFRGLIEKIPYLKELGVTAVELLPVMEYDDTEILRTLPDGTPLRNYWGYSTVGFFAPDAALCVSPEEGSHLEEFRDMVRALHEADIEVILDVVFNHTNEGNHEGPTIAFKGLDNSTYYHLVKNDPQYYQDYSGCGNTVNCNHPIVEKLIQESLEFWARDMHVDGFRFDEGSILSRGLDGSPMEFPPLLWNIELCEELADTKVIAEAWDAAGLYQIGYFPGTRWAEWNGKFRDDVRRFVKGEPGVAGAVASRIAGSSDLYQSRGHLPINSINFITCHDGFTLRDLVTYDRKHNEANGEGNRDGIDDNLSWNCGVEGPSDDEAIERQRKRQMKNFAAILFLSRGVPMFGMGDEVGRTQRGNNNAYCQNNEISWFDWTQVEANRDLFRFFREMIRFRKSIPTLHRPRFFDGSVNERGLADIAWHGTQLGAPPWNDPEGSRLAFTLGGSGETADIHVMMNMHWGPADFELPQVAGYRWHRFADTSRPSPEDVAEPGTEPAVDSNTYCVGDRSVVVLVSRPASKS